MKWHYVFRDNHKAHGNSGKLRGTRGTAYPRRNSDGRDQREYFEQVFGRIYRVSRHYTCSTTGGDQEEVPRHLWQNDQAEGPR